MLLLHLDLLFPPNIVIHPRLVVLSVAIVHLGPIILLQLKFPTQLE
jgi:hypothetical protein